MANDSGNAEDKATLPAAEAGATATRIAVRSNDSTSAHLNYRSMRIYARIKEVEATLDCKLSLSSSRGFTALDPETQVGKREDIIRVNI